MASRLSRTLTSLSVGHAQDESNYDSCESKFKKTEASHSAQSLQTEMEARFQVRASTPPRVEKHANAVVPAFEGLVGLSIQGDVSRTDWVLRVGFLRFTVSNSIGETAASLPESQRNRWILRFSTSVLT